MSKENASLILCTTADEESAEFIANNLVENRLAACVNILPQLKSVYRWKDKIEKDSEVLLLIKSKAELFEQIKNRVKKIHSYETPELVLVNIEDIEENYLKWLLSSL